MWEVLYKQILSLGLIGNMWEVLYKQMLSLGLIGTLLHGR